jgi:hypothetical protein
MEPIAGGLIVEEGEPHPGPVTVETAPQPHHLDGDDIAAHFEEPALTDLDEELGGDESAARGEIADLAFEAQFSGPNDGCGPHGHSFASAAAPFRAHHLLGNIPTATNHAFLGS